METMTIDNTNRLFPQTFNQTELPLLVNDFYNHSGIAFFDSVDVYEYSNSTHYTHTIPINELGFNSYVFLGSPSIVTFSRDMSMISHVIHEGDVVILPEITKTSNLYEDSITIDPLDNDPTYVLATRISRKIVFNHQQWMLALEEFALFRDRCKYNY